MTAFLYVKQELDDIAVLHYIFLTFGAVEAPGLDFAHFSAALHQGVEIAHLRANKAAFEVGVDFAGGLGAELDELKALMTAGVGTFVCMHMDAGIVKALQEDNRCNVLCMGHMASDSIGFNQILDAWEARGVEITRIGGLI